MPTLTRVAVLQEKALVSLSWVLLWQKCKTIQSCGWHEYECQPKWSWIRDPRLSVLSTWFYTSYSCPFRLDRQTNTTTTTTNSLEDEAGRGLREFKGGLGHKGRPCLKKKKTKSEGNKNKTLCRIWGDCGNLFIRENKSLDSQAHAGTQKYSSSF